MITIGSFKDFKPEQYDEVWVIARSVKDQSIFAKYNNVFHVLELSPSPSLLSYYLSLKKAGAWNVHTFSIGYVMTFLNEMRQQPAKDKLNELYFKDKSGKCILLICYCVDESMCHRSIIAGLMQGIGVSVVSVNGYKDYSNYYYRYKNPAPF